MNNRQVAINWRKQTKTNGHSLNMFYENGIIYSYGRHFPMAFITSSNYENKTIILQNSDNYSHTTAKHLNYMRSQCYSDPVITMSTERLQEAINYFKDSSTSTIGGLKVRIENEIQARKAEQEKKLIRARSEYKKEFYKQEIVNNNLQLDIVRYL